MAVCQVPMQLMGFRVRSDLLSQGSVCSGICLSCSLKDIDAIDQLWIDFADVLRL